MAGSSICIILVAFFFTISFADLTIPEQEFLHECAENVGEKCGDQWFGKLFSPNKTIVSRDCCYKLLQMGYSCHVKMTIYILETEPALQNVSRIDVLTKSDHIFQKCDRVTEPEDQKFLAKCVEEIGAECGEEVYNKLIHDGNITKPCCQKLVNMGLKCHTNMVKALLRTPPMRNVDAIQFLKKNKKIFEECKHTE
ncbi:uncharacterized protein [Cicer arietinum]|uniref:uncharacterized protein n=1 Tax=Cicer arietinum TaxID=3827 RepID=UPI003CC57E55